MNFGKRKQDAGRALGVSALVIGVLLATVVAKGFASDDQREEQLIESSILEGREVIMPPDLNLTLDWYSPPVPSNTTSPSPGFRRRTLDT